LATLAFKAVALPAVRATAAVDYIAYEPGRERVWVPIANTGSVDVFDIATRTFTRIDGFTTSELEVKGSKRTMGPSAVSIGDGFAYVGNRATQEVCSVSTSTLTIGMCLKLPSATDGVAYVASAKEVWVTTPRVQAIAVLDASKPDALVSKATVKLDGAPEGYALDDRRGLFFTNLEDRNKTVVIDIKSHKLRATWSLDCSSDGPRGIAADAKRAFLYVACTDQVLVLDSARNGAKLAMLDTGGGVDNVDWLEARQLLYVAAGKSAALTVAHVDDRGQLSVVARSATADGARNGVADASGNAYVVDRANARLLVFPYTP
jgi:DNA-binding beta-propeller fold protein YncE